MNRAFLASAATPALSQRVVPSHTGFGSNTIDRVQEIAPFFGSIAPLAQTSRAGECREGEHEAVAAPQSFRFDVNLTDA